MKELSEWELMNTPLDAAQRMQENKMLYDAKILRQELEKASQLIDGKQLLLNINFRKKYGFSEDPKPTIPEILRLYFDGLELQRQIKNNELEELISCFWNKLKEMKDEK